MQLLISHHPSNRDAAQTLEQALGAQGISACLAGQVPLAETLAEAQAVAVLLGEQGVSEPQKHFIGLATARQTRQIQAGHPWPVVPVLLPGAALAPAFLFSEKWIDLRHNLTDPTGLARLSQAVHGVSQPRPHSTLVPHCPYPGLPPFREEEAAFFFGREALVGRLAAAVQNEPVVTLIGPPGSGKTSLVQAGLIPHLRRATATVEMAWDTLRVPVAVDERPFAQLAAALLAATTPRPAPPQIQHLSDQLAAGRLSLAEAAPKHTTTAPRLLVIDQLETLFTPGAVAQWTALERMLHTALAEDPALHLLLVVDQAGYGPALSQSEALRAHLAAHVIPVALPEPEALRQAITQPARLVNIACERPLVERLVAETEHLAMLQFSLQTLWRERQAGLLSLRSYEALGGRDGLVDAAAERSLQALSPTQQVQFERMLADLIRLDTQGTHRGAGQASLRWVNLPDFLNDRATSQDEAVAYHLIDDGLLVTRRDLPTGQEQISLAGELLLRRWRRLQAWLAETREFLLWQRRFEPLAAQHSPRLDRASLREANHWQALRPDLLTVAEHELIRRENARDRRHRFTRWAVVGGVLFVVIFLAGLIGWWQNRLIRTVAGQRDVALTAAAEARLARQIETGKRAIADADRLAAEQQKQQVLAEKLAVQADLMLDDIDHGLVPGTLLAAESLRRASSIAGEQVLRRSITRLPRATLQFTHPAVVQEAIFSPDAERLVTRSGSTARIWDTATGEAIVRLIHDNPVSDAAFSPDGRWLVTASRDQTVRVWDATTGREVGRLRHEDTVSRVLFSPDGQWLITQGDQAAYAWGLALNVVGQLTQSVTTARPHLENASVALALKRLNKGEPPPETRQAIIGQGTIHMAHGANVLAMALSPDGQWLATAGADHLVRVWEVATGQEVARLPHRGAAQSVAFNPSGRLLVSGSRDHTVRVWSMATISASFGAGDRQPPAPEIELDQPAGIELVAFSPDDRWLVTSATDNTVRVWLVSRNSTDSIEALREVAQMVHQDRVLGISFNVDSNWLATASIDGSVRVWWTATGRQIARMDHEGGVTGVSFSPDDRWLATTGQDQTARLWEMTIGYEATQMAHAEWVLDVVYSSDGRWLATRNGNLAQIWEADTGRELFRLPHDKWVNAIIFSADSRWLATTNNHEVIVWGLPEGREMNRLRHTSLVRRIAFGPAGGNGARPLLALTGMDSVVQVWDVDSGKVVARLPHGAWINALAFSPDGQWLATASRDKSARVWEVATGQEITRLPHDKVVNDIAFSPDGQWLATASADGTARLWLATATREVARLSHQSGVQAVAFSPDGRRLATRSTNIVRIWSVPAGQAVAQMPHERAVTAMMFSPDSRLVATASSDSMARMWEVESGQSLATLAHEYWVNAVVFSPDGRFLATASADHKARIWFLSRDDLLAEACVRLPRNLTRTEWQKFLGSEPYRSTCPNLPPGQ